MPTPTLPFVLMKSVEVPVSAFVPLKYATWPVVPVKSDDVAMESDCEPPALRVVSVPERPRPRVAVVVPTDESAFVPFPYKSWLEVNVD